MTKRDGALFDSILRMVRELSIYRNIFSNGISEHTECTNILSALDEFNEIPWIFVPGLERHRKTLNVTYCH